MMRLYLVFGVITAFDLSTDFGYLALAVIALHVFHKGMHKSH